MMHAAEQIYQPYQERQEREKRQTAHQIKKAHAAHHVKPKSYFRETCALLICVIAFMALNLFLLGRFAEITSMKHQVSQMEKSFEQLQNQREQLMIEIEKSSKLEWIEHEALTRLGMKYPDKNQMIYISVDPARVAIVAGQINQEPLEEIEGGGLLPQSIEKIFHKFAGVLRI
jgi:cell division protein FtsL